MTLAQQTAERWLDALKDPLAGDSFMLAKELMLAGGRQRRQRNRSKIGTRTRVKRAARVTSAKAKAKPSKAGAMVWTPGGQLHGFHPGADSVSPGAAAIAQEAVDLGAAMVVVADERAALRDHWLEQRLEARIQKLEEKGA